MPQIIVSHGASTDLERLTAFLIDANAMAQANKIIKLLTTAFKEIANNPMTGKAFTLSDNEDLTGIREVKLRFGKSGYQFLFWHDIQADVVIILAIRHYREQHYALYS